MKRKCLAIGIIFLFVGTCIIPAIAQDTEKPLPTSRGNWLYVGGSGLGNYTTIQSGINDADAGDTVFVYDDLSPYYENVVIGKSINLIGEDRNATVIDAEYIGSVVEIDADNILVKGFTIQKSGKIAYVDEYGAGVFIKTSHHHNNISNNIIVNNNGFGVALWYCANNNTVNSNIIENNNNDGINLQGSDYNIIKNNIIENNKDPFEDNEGQGIFISYRSRPSKNNIISDNIISNHNAYGIRIGEGIRNTISSNILDLNTIGLAIHPLGHDGYGSFNIIKKNNFLRNHMDALLQSAFFNQWSRNYWGRAKIFPKIIIGFILIPLPSPDDDTLSIPYCNIDLLPAIKPYTIGG